MSFLDLAKHGLKGWIKISYILGLQMERIVEREKIEGEKKKKRKRKRRRREEKRKKMEEQKGMELYEISKVLNGFPCNCMVIILPKPRVC